MLKNLFNFKVSEKLLVAKIVMLVGMLAAIVITAFGLVEIMDVKLMKEVLGATRPLMGDVMLFLLKKYLVWALLILAAVVSFFLVTRYQENKKVAA